VAWRLSWVEVLVVVPLRRDPPLRNRNGVLRAGRAGEVAT